MPESGGVGTSAETPFEWGIIFFPRNATDIAQSLGPRKVDKLIKATKTWTRITKSHLYNSKPMVATRSRKISTGEKTKCKSPSQICVSSQALMGPFTMGKELKEFQLCDSRRLRKKAQDAQDDVIELFDFFDVRFGVGKFELGLPTSV